MAKQTFTTGQVLTAAQMTSLQQTAMLGGNAAVKTTSYVLVAADAGTSVAMNSTSATTVTVNTGLFAAGDIVTIINQNTGVCTVTAGTATVRKASGASLALSQYQGGVLNFISASEAIFFPFDVGGGLTSPLTTKGDLWTYSTTDARLGVGTTNQVLSVDSSTATGLKWTTLSTGSQTVITSGTFSGTTNLSLSSFGGYKDLRLIITGAYSGTAANYFNLTVNGLATGIWNSAFANSNSSSVSNNENIGNISLVEDTTTGTNAANTSIFDLYNYTESSNAKVGRIVAITYSNSNSKWIMRSTGFGVRVTAAVTSINVQSAVAMQGSYELIGIN